MEIVKILRKTALTSRESKIVWFLIGELYGNLHEEKLIKTEEFSEGTGMSGTKVIESIHALIKKGVIIRRSTTLLGCYWYAFDKKKFGRVYAVETIKPDVKGLKLLQGGKGIIFPKELSPNEEIQQGDITQDAGCQQGDITQDQGSTLLISGNVSRSKISQSLSRGETISQRQKELDAHEERKREYIPRGGESLQSKIERWKEGKVG